VSPVRIVRLRAPSAGERALFVAGIRQRAHIAAGAGAQVDDMYAVIRTGGKQYRVAENDVVVVERIAGEAGDEVTLGDVLMVAGDGDVKVGAPLVDGAAVKATLVEQTRGDKIIVFKKKRRQNYRRKRGHRQDLSVLRITGITA